MNVTHKFVIDLLHRDLTKQIFAVQGDANTRKVEVTLMSGAEAWSVPAGTSVSVAYRNLKSGGHGWYDRLPDGSAACTVIGNVVTVTLAPAVTAADGQVEANIVMRDGSLNQLATFALSVMVERNPAAGTALHNDYYAYSTLEDINGVLDNILGAADLARGQAILLTAAGSTAHLDGSANAPVQGLTVYGQSTQNGTPTTAAPAPIVSVGDSGSLNVLATDGTQSNTVTVTEGLPLRCIGEYRDELVVSASGGYLKKRIAVYNQQDLVASHISTSGTGSGARRALGGDQFSITGSALQSTSAAAHTGILCANLPVVSQPQERNFNYPVLAAYGHADKLELRLRFPMSYTDAQILSIAKNTYVLYPLAEPQIIPLSGTQVQAILALRTYKPETDITAEGAEMEVTYAADTKLYIDNKFAELQAIITA